MFITECSSVFFLKVQVREKITIKAIWICITCILRQSDGLGITLEISCTAYWLPTPVKNGLKNRY